MTTPKYTEKTIERYHQNQFYLELKKKKSREELVSVCKDHGIDLNQEIPLIYDYQKWKLSKKLKPHNCDPNPEIKFLLCVSVTKNYLWISLNSKGSSVPLVMAAGKQVRAIE